jgi:hypothetical protein
MGRGIFGVNVEAKARMRSIATYLIPPISRGIVLAVCVVLPMAGCIKSKGPLISADKASTPLPAGLYYSVSNLSSGGNSPVLKGPSRVMVKGNAYTAMPLEPDDGKPARFHLFRVTDAGSVYILQTDEDNKQGYRDILIGVVTKDGFCSKDIRNFPPRAVTGDEVVSQSLLLQWLAESAAEIASTPNDVCFVRKSG